MKAAVMRRECQWCHEPIVTHDLRIKYCCKQCSEDAHRAKCRENFRKRYAEKREQELERNKDYYRRHPEKSCERVRRFIQRRKNNATN